MRYVRSSPKIWIDERLRWIQPGDRGRFTEKNEHRIRGRRIKWKTMKKQELIKRYDPTNPKSLRGVDPYGPEAAI